MMTISRFSKSSSLAFASLLCAGLLAACTVESTTVNNNNAGGAGGAATGTGGGTTGGSAGSTTGAGGAITGGSGGSAAGSAGASTAGSAGAGGSTTGAGGAAAGGAIAGAGGAKAGAGGSAAGTGGAAAGAGGGSAGSGDEPDMCTDGGTEHASCDDCLAVEQEGALGCCSVFNDACGDQEGCVALLNCIVACGGDTACQQDCENAASESDIASAQMLIDCLYGAPGAEGACSAVCP